MANLAWQGALAAARFVVNNPEYVKYGYKTVVAAKSAFDKVHDAKRGIQKRPAQQTPKSSPEKQSPIKKQKPAEMPSHSESDHDMDTNTSAAASISPGNVASGVGVADVALNPPEKTEQEPMRHSRIYKKKNRFTVHISEFQKVPLLFATGQPVNTQTNILPWRSSGMYMNHSEMAMLQALTSRYRYVGCRHNFTNFSTHSAQISGSTTFNVQYGGVNCYSGVFSERQLGHYMISKIGNSWTPPTNCFTHEETINTFSSNQRERGYKQWQPRLWVHPKVHHRDVDGKTIYSNTFDPLDHCTTTIGNMPHKTFEHIFPERWRNGFWGAPGYVWGSTTIADSANLQHTNQGFATLEHAASTHRYPMAGMGPDHIGQCDDVCPSYFQQQSSMAVMKPNTGVNYHTLMEDTTQISQPVFLFGFVIPIPEDLANDPNIFVSFELESELLVEYENLLDTTTDILTNRNWVVKHDNIGSWSAPRDDAQGFVPGVNIINAIASRTSTMFGEENPKHYLGAENNRLTPYTANQIKLGGYFSTSQYSPDIQPNGNTGRAIMIDTDSSYNAASHDIALGKQ